MLRTIEWENGQLVLLDQTALPDKVTHIVCSDEDRVAEAIRRLEVRGAPAIGAAAAFGLVLAARRLRALEPSEALFRAELLKAKQKLAQTRPTAVNLFWALERMWQLVESAQSPLASLVASLEAEALAIMAEDRALNKAISRQGAKLFAGQRIAVLTHCNAGALATCGQGTALGVIRDAFANGNIAAVYADETRPLLQGARLTAWELQLDGIPITLITDNMAAWVMKEKRVQAVIVGADRIAANGDTANKIGTYGLAVLAKAHGLPFYIAAPSTTFDFTLASGELIPIEERAPEEVRQVRGTVTAPKDVPVFNPAFDVTPAGLITGIITEFGVLQAPYDTAIETLQKQLKTGRKTNEDVDKCNCQSGAGA